MCTFLSMSIYTASFIANEAYSSSSSGGAFISCLGYILHSLISFYTVPIVPFASLCVSFACDCFAKVAAWNPSIHVWF